MILLIDNHDSFVHNLARYLRRLGQTTEVVRSDQLTARDARQLAPRAIVISPGPCTPAEAGCSLEVVRELAPQCPILGVCLGHQTIAAAWGARIVRSPEPMHGRASEILHQGDGVFAGLPNPFIAGRYHSLVVDEATLPECLQVTARSASGLIMGLHHRTWPVVGVQFHPESVLTTHGYPLLANFLRLAGLQVREVPAIEQEYPAPAPRAWTLPNVPVTF